MIACVQVLLAQWGMINYQLLHPPLVLQLGLQTAREILKATLVCINYEDEVFCLQRVTAAKSFLYITTSFT